MVNIVLLLLKMEVREDMRVVIIIVSIIFWVFVDRGNRFLSFIGWMLYIKLFEVCLEIFMDLKNFIFCSFNKNLFYRYFF